MKQLSTRDLLIGLIAIAAVFALSGATRTTDADGAAPRMFAHATQAQRIAWCTRHHRGDWPAIAGCKIHATWTGSRRTAREAVRVGWCESKLSPVAGVPRKTYWGTWQMDADARSTYGYGPTLVEQTRATQRMHSRRGWQPWPRCRPGGADHARRWNEAPATLRAYG